MFSEKNPGVENDKMCVFVWKNYLKQLVLIADNAFTFFQPLLQQKSLIVRCLRQFVALFFVGN